MTKVRNDNHVELAARTQKIRVMIVDDSAVARSVFTRILGAQPDIEIVCIASSSEEALQFLSSNAVDTILLDIELPGRSGLEALPDFLAANNGARVLIVSSIAERNGPAAIKALSLGACETLAKPGRTGYSGDFSRQLIEKVVRLGRKQERLAHATALRKSRNGDNGALTMPGCIAIGASTGGIPAIYEILEALDDSVDCPIFITQHLPAAFMGYFATQVSKVSGRNVEIAEVGKKIEKRSIYLAPGDSHICVSASSDNLYFSKYTRQLRSRYCPSVDVMLSSLFDAYGNDMLAVILSGMGNDGVKAARLIDAKGGKIIVQDIDSSVVWGMPGAIAKNGLAYEILNPSGIAQKLNEAGADVA